MARIQLVSAINLTSDNIRYHLLPELAKPVVFCSACDARHLHSSSKSPVDGSAAFVRKTPGLDSGPVVGNQADIHEEGTEESFEKFPQRKQYCFQKNRGGEPERRRPAGLSGGYCQFKTDLRSATLVWL